MFTRSTEQDSNYNDLQDMSVEDLLLNINAEDKTVPNAIEKVIPDISKLTIEIVSKMKLGGRLFYLGAGTLG